MAFVRVASCEELEDGDCTSVDVDGVAIALFNVDGEIYALANECPHVGGPLGEGDFEGDVVTCPWHGAEFDVKSGEVRCGPAEEAVRSYPVKIEAGEIHIELP